MRCCTTMAAQKFCAVLSILLFSLIHIMLVPLCFYKKITWLSFPPALCLVFCKQPMHPALSFEVSQSKREQIPSTPFQHRTATPGQRLRNSSRASTPILLVAKKGSLLLPAAVVMPSNRQVYSKALQNASCRMVKMMEVMPAKQRLRLQTSSCRLASCVQVLVTFPKDWPPPQGQNCREPVSTASALQMLGLFPLTRPPYGD